MKNSQTKTKSKPERFLTQQEIANILGISSARVGQIERRALKKMRALVNQELLEEG